jgi:hypothetical protein
VSAEYQDDPASTNDAWLKRDGSLAKERQHFVSDLFRCLQVLEANAAAPEDQRLSEAELVVDLPRLQQLRGQVDAEVAALLARSSSETQAQEIRAARIKAMCWDAMQVRLELDTGCATCVFAVEQVWTVRADCAPNLDVANQLCTQQHMRACCSSHRDATRMCCVMCAAADEAGAVHRAEVRCSGGVKLRTASTR